MFKFLQRRTAAIVWRVLTAHGIIILTLGAFLRVEAKDNAKVTEYTSETLTDAIEMNVEVR